MSAPSMKTESLGSKLASKESLRISLVFGDVGSFIEVRRGLADFLEAICGAVGRFPATGVLSAVLKPDLARRQEDRLDKEEAEWHAAKSAPAAITVDGAATGQQPTPAKGSAKARDGTEVRTRVPGARQRFMHEAELQAHQQWRTLVVQSRSMRDTRWLRESLVPSSSGKLSKKRTQCMVYRRLRGMSDIQIQRVFLS